MKPKYTYICRFVLILLFSYAVSIGTAAAQSTARLIVSRDPNLDRNLAIVLRLDGRTVATLRSRQTFDNPVWTGRRVLSVSALSKRFRFPGASRGATRPTSMTLDVRRGRTYVFTAVWQRPDRVVLVRGR